MWITLAVAVGVLALIRLALGLAQASRTVDGAFLVVSRRGSAAAPAVPDGRVLTGRR